MIYTSSYDFVKRNLKIAHHSTVATSSLYTVSGKKGTNSILGITSANTGRFSKFFQYHNLLEICNKTVIKFPINLKRVVTLPCEILMSKN